VIAEDLALLREGLVALLREHEIEVVAQVDDGEGLLRAIAGHRPDLAIVDVRLPPTFSDEGLRAAIEARRRQPELGVLVLSQYVETAYARELIGENTAGIGYLLKERVGDVSAFLDALRQVAAGGTVLDRQVVTQLLAPRERGGQTLPQLTAREGEVLQLMAEGRSNAAIAETLVVTPGAVEKHIRNIFAKLELPACDEDHRRVLAVLTYLREAQGLGQADRKRARASRQKARL
jgi:DNA-binding NarL/FixJ family response regulator